MPTMNVQSAIEIIQDAQREPASAERRRVAAAVDDLVRMTADTYSRESETYCHARTSQPWGRDAYMMRALLDLLRTRAASGDMPLAADRRIRVLDVGAGYGRDVLLLRQEPDVEAVALENADGFVAALRALQLAGRLPADGVVAADMRSIPELAESTFQCVRNHAALHHLPVVCDGLGADAAVAEARRVLVPGGVFYALVKAGDGIRVIDTKEGLGGRFFQLFTETLLRQLLGRHLLKIIHLEHLLEPRASGDVPWIFALSVAVEG